MKRRFLAVLGAVGLLVPGVAAPSAAQPPVAQTLHIEVGSFFSSVPGEAMQFLAPELNVHPDDVLNFTGGFHTATAIPANQDPATWIGQNVGLGQPYSLLAADPDEGLTSIKYNNNAIFPNMPNCGVVAAGAPPCSYDGTETVNSGILFLVTSETGTGGFSMEVNASPGDTFYILCLAHPAMILKVNVVAPNATATTQAEIDAHRTATLAATEEAAHATHTQYANRRQTRRLSGGRRLHQAWAGIDGPGFALFEMYPLTLNLKKGDKVNWNFEQLIYEIHTVTIPRSEANAISSTDFVPQCDPDTDTGSAPDTEPTFDPTGFPTCPSGSALEVDGAARFLVPEGDRRWTGRTDVEHSAVRSPNLPSPPTQGGADYKVTFAALTGDRAQAFACAVHPFMVGKFKVARR